MFAIREYWEDIRKIDADLPDGNSFLVMSIGDPLRGRVGGVVSEVTRQMAARAIHERRARLATAAETEQYQEQQRVRANQALADARTKAGLGVFVLPAAKENARK